MEPAPRTELDPSAPAAETKPTDKPTRPVRPKIAPAAFDTAQWGLASLLYNGILVLLMPPTTLIYTLIPISIHQVRFWDNESMIAASILMPTAAIILSVLTLIGLVFALTGWYNAGCRRQSVALHIAGTLIAVLALLCWVGTAVNATILAFGIWNIK